MNSQIKISFWFRHPNRCKESTSHFPRPGNAQSASTEILQRWRKGDKHNSWENIFFAGKLKIYVNLIFLMYQKLSRKVHGEIDGLKEYLYIHVSKKWRDWGFNPASASHGQKTLSLTPGGCAEHSLVKTWIWFLLPFELYIWINRLCFFGLPHWWMEQQRIWPVFVRNNCQVVILPTEFT